VVGRLVGRRVGGSDGGGMGSCVGLGDIELLVGSCTGCIVGGDGAVVGFSSFTKSTMLHL